MMFDSVHKAVFLRSWKICITLELTNVRSILRAVCYLHDLYLDKYGVNNKVNSLLLATTLVKFAHSILSSSESDLNEYCNDRLDNAEIVQEISVALENPHRFNLEEKIMSLPFFQILQYLEIGWWTWEEEKEYLSRLYQTRTGKQVDQKDLITISRIYSDDFIQRLNTFNLSMVEGNPKPFDRSEFNFWSDLETLESQKRV